MLTYSTNFQLKCVRLHQCRNCHKRTRGVRLPPLPLPLPSPSFLPFPLPPPAASPKTQLGGMEERCKLPQCMGSGAEPRPQTHFGDILSPGDAILRTILVHVVCTTLSQFKQKLLKLWSIETLQWLYSSHCTATYPWHSLQYINLSSFT